jgi:hypothetical protein
MTTGTMAEALAPLRARLGPILREREILRVAAQIVAEDMPAAMGLARREVLAWAQKRCGRLPDPAWHGQSFEHMVGGRTALGVRIERPHTDLWAVRGDDPDKGVPGRIWTTEVVIGRLEGRPAQLSLRLLMSSPEDEPAIDPAVPSLLREIAASCGLASGGHKLSVEPWRIGTDEDAAALVELLRSPERLIPVVVASGDERAADPAAPSIDVATLARAMLGLAHVVVVPAALTYRLSDEFGKIRSVYHGAARLYLPGFDADADPYDHRLIMGDQLRADPVAQLTLLRRRLARESLRRTRLGHDVLPFAAVRSTALQLEQEAKSAASTGDAERLETALRRVEALTRERDQLRAEADAYLELAHSEEQRANHAESQLARARERILDLEQRLRRSGQAIDDGLALPRAWADVADWCDRELLGRLSLAPAARQGLKKARFADLERAVRCLLWLANACRERRLNGGGPLANVTVEPGIENAPCGADTFRFDFQGRRLDADWHIKNGGNTRDPRRCLRIYYAWDETTRQIVVAEMPAHRPTGAS